MCNRIMGKILIPLNWLHISSAAQWSASFFPHFFPSSITRSKNTTTKCTWLTLVVTHFYGLQCSNMMQKVKLGAKI